MLKICMYFAVHSFTLFDGVLLICKDSLKVNNLMC